MKLYLVYLGGKLVPGRVGEDHETVVVVAQDASAARKAAKAKWGGVGDAHVDAVQELDVVDSHKICLIHVIGEDKAPVDNTWSP